MTEIVTVILAVLAMIFVGYPLFRSRSEEALEPAAEGSEVIDDLLSQKESTYSAIKELEFDRELGNLNESDYQDLSERYKKKAVTILKDLDDFEKVSNPEGTTDNVEDQIENEVLALRQSKERSARKKKTMFCSQCGHAYAVGDSFCSSCGTSLALACANCGTPHEEDDRFCAKCGREL